MQLIRFVAVLFSFIFLLPESIRSEFRVVGKCGEYSFVGKLSEDLRVAPVLFANSESGIPLEIELKVRPSQSVRAINLRGSPVKAKLTVKKILGPRNLEAELVQIEPTKIARLKESDPKSGGLLKEIDCK